MYMSNSQQKPSVDNEALSSFDQAEEIFSDLVEQLKDREFMTLLDKYNEEFVAAEPTTELTDDNLEAIEQARAAEQLQRRCEYARKLSRAVMKRMSGSPDSELFKTAKRVLDLLDEIATDDKSRWRELDTAMYTLVQLCRGEDKKPVEAKQNAVQAERWGIWTCVKKIPRWIYVLVIFLAALLTIFHYLGWL